VTSEWLTRALSILVDHVDLDAEERLGGRAGFQCGDGQRGDHEAAIDHAVGGADLFMNIMFIRIMLENIMILCIIYPHGVCK
jgi:hypothetical protein